MKIEVDVNISAPDLKELAEALKNLVMVKGVEAPAADVEPVKPEPAPVVSEPKKEPQQAEEEPSPYSKEDVRNALTTLGQTKGKDQAKAVLTAVGVTKFSDLTESMYGDVIARCKELM